MVREKKYKLMENLPACTVHDILLDEAPDNIECIALYPHPPELSPSTSDLKLRSLSSSPLLATLDRRQEEVISAGGFPRMEMDKMTIFVSCSNGAMHVYERMSTKDCYSTSNGETVRLRLSLKRFHPSKQPASQMLVVDKWGVLFCISGGDLTCHSLTGDPLLDPVAGLPDLKGVYSICVNTESDLICIITKRCISIFSKDENVRRGSWLLGGSKNAMNFKPLHEMKTSETPRTCLFCNASVLVVGMPSDYIFFDANTGNEIKRPRVRTGIRKSPVLCNGIKNEVLVVRDNQGFFLDCDGLPTRSKGSSGERIMWNDPPNILMAAPPYLISCDPRKIQVFLLDNCMLCQNIHLADCSSVATNVSSTNPLLQASALSRRATVLVASRKTIHMFTLSSIPELVDDVLASNNLQLALDILMSASKSDNPVGAGIPVNRLGYVESRVQFLFARLQFDVSTAEPCFKTARKHLESATRLPVDLVCLLFANSELFNGIQDARDFSSHLEELRLEVDERMHVGSELNELVPQDLIDLNIDELARLQGTQLSLALFHVFLPLVYAHRSLLLKLKLSCQGNVEFIVDDLLAVMDTVLLKGFVLWDSGRAKIPSDVETRSLIARLTEQKLVFLRSENWCDVNECEKLLLLYPEMWEELLWLYYGKSMHEKALDWLRSLTNQGTQEPEIYRRKTIEYLTILGKPYEEMVLRYSKWILESFSKPKEALSIFTDAEAPIDEPVVLKHLEEHDQRMMAVGGKPFLSILYLEHMIHQGKSEDSLLHNKLVMLYIEYILNLQKTAGDTEIISQARSSLLQFLKSSRFYSALDLSHRLHATKLYGEYCVVLSRLHRHKEALEVVIKQVGDSFKEALAYCQSLYDPNDAHTKDLYLLLLEVLMQNTMIEQAMELVETHFKELDPLKTLMMLPADTSVQTLQPYLETVLRHRYSQHRGSQVVKNLVRKEHVSVMDTHATLQRKYSVVTRTTICANPLCHKNFQGDSAIARLPNGSIVHYACLQNMII